MLCDTGSCRIDCVNIGSRIPSARGRARKRNRFLAMRCLTSTQAIVPCFPAAEVLDYGIRILGVEVSVRPSFVRADEYIAGHGCIRETILDHIGRPLHPRSKGAVLVSSAGGKNVRLPHADQIVGELKIRNLFPVDSHAQNKNSAWSESSIVTDANIAQRRLHRTDLRECAKPSVALT